ncbi:MAG: sensor histidine kinase [Bacteroidales bacterium]|nr:sensor histidine kinase [Bacteroidales bacterium]
MKEKIIYRRKLPRVLLHVLFWIMYLGFFVIQSAYLKEKPDYQLIFLSLSLTMFVDIAATYFTAYLLLPGFLFKRKYWGFFFLFLVSAVVFILIQRTILYYITYPKFYDDYLDKYTFWQFNFLYSFVNIYSIVGAFTAIKLLKYWYENQRIRADLINQNKTSELALLRSQINPHFLFNTLNNIDSLVFTDQNMASDSIIKLSEIMRYMLYETNTEEVLLEKEISYLRSYIALQKIRQKNPDFIKFTISGEYHGRTIAPMIFVPFVENAYKHSAKSVDPPGIKIDLIISDERIVFKTWNRKFKEQEPEKDETNGIGLANVKRRLELLYPQKYELIIQEDNDDFKVELIIGIK